MLDVEVVNVVLESELGLIPWFQSSAQICVLGFVVEEVDSSECLKGIRMYFSITQPLD